MKPTSKNLISVSLSNILLIFLSVLFICLGSVNFYLLNESSANAIAFSQKLSKISPIPHQLRKNSQNAALGNEAAFAALTTNANSFSSLWHDISISEDIQSFEVSQNSKHWKNIEEQLAFIQKYKSNSLEYSRFFSYLFQSTTSLQSSFSALQKIAAKEKSPNKTQLLIQNEIYWLERVKGNTKTLLTEPSNNAQTLIQQQIKTLSNIKRISKSLHNNAAHKLNSELAKKEFAKIFNTLKSLQNLQIPVEKNLITIESLHEAAIEVDGLSKQIETNLVTIQKSMIKDTSASLFPSPQLGTGSFFIALLLLFLNFWYIIKEASLRRLEVEAENEKNENAIIRLLDELGNLADGDLTVQATVGEDFTGAIADSINYSIDQTRILVASINKVAQLVTNAAEETHETTRQLSQATEHQNEEITAVSDTMKSMAESIDQVSANATELLNTAEKSVGIAKKGSKVTQDTIEGMGSIREQIQDTSKRIKRLGESSQEIGDIISLIYDIADQTNILSLNAAIQASMAGDAGRGFAVVADEVQRLAERASAATKQIEALVRTIQSDTTEAVKSMEDTTAQVVQGAKLAENAGVALEEIEGVSNNLAGLIGNISNTAKKQARSAGNISETMMVIKQITGQTSQGTTITAQSVKNLTKLSTQMRDSIAGFKLPRN